MNNVTESHIESMIDIVRYHKFEDTTVTVCCITLTNSFCVVGQSACADPANFDANLGRALAFEDAKRKIWELEGYVLRRKLNTEQLVEKD